MKEKKLTRNLVPTFKKLTFLAAIPLVIYLLFPLIAQTQSEQLFIEQKEQPPEFLIGNNAGDLDPTFLGNGKTSLDVYGNVNDYATSVVRQPDGKIIAAGERNQTPCLVRYNTDGSLDQTFWGPHLFGSNTPKGIAFSGVQGGYFNDVLLQPDGKIIGVGIYNIGSGDRWTNVTRFNSDGSLDTTFSGDGVFLYSHNGGDDYSLGGALQSDGKLVVGGKVSDSVTQLLRINTDGSLDTTFGGTGYVNWNYSGYSRSIAYSIAIDSAGKIVVGGYALNANYDYAITRLNSDGTFDSSFVGGSGTVSGGTGRLIVEVTGNNDFANHLKLQSDGKIVLAGYSVASGSNHNFTMIRLNTNGSLDTDFDGDGRVQTDFSGGFDDVGRGLDIQADGKIVRVGETNTVGVSRYDFGVIRYNPNGSLDTTFGTGGKLTTQFNANNSIPEDVVVQPDGKIVAVSRSNWGSVDIAAVRYNPNGSLDTSWGVGKKQVDFANNDDFAADVAQQTDGKLVVVGRTLVSGNFRFALTRYNADGTLDTAGFGSGTGKSSPFLVNSDYGESVAIDSATGKIYVGGFDYNGAGDYDFMLARYNANGSLDTSFGTSGFARRHFSSDDRIHAIALLSDGDVVAVGYTTTANIDIAVLRFDVATNGWDTGFDGDGLRTIPNANTDIAYDVAIDSSGKIIVGGVTNPSSSDFILLRLNAATGATEMTVATPTTYNDEIRALALQPDGKIVVAGFGNTGANGDDFIVARYTSTGIPDTSFDFDGRQITTFTSGTDGASGVAIQADGKILASGYAVGGVYNDFAFARYNSDGSLDTTFGNGGQRMYDFSGYHDYANGKMLVQADGKAVAVGQSNNGINVDMGVMRILTNSAADCSYSLSTYNQNIVQAGASHSVNVTTTSECTWTAVSNVSWLQFTGSTNGTGNGTINYSVDANPNAVSRTGTITIGGQTLTVTQYGANMLVSIPTTLTAQNGAVLTVPISVNDTTGQNILSYDFTLTYDPSVITPQVTPYDTSGTLSSGFVVTVNATTPGTLIVSGFGTSVLSGAGALLNLKFNVVGNYPSCSNLNFTAFEFNTGNPPDQTSNGQFCVINGNITGTITYVNGSPTQPAVQNVTVTAVGSTTITDTTDAAGFYELTGFAAGAYTVTPTKTGDVNGITAFDAALVAQHVVGLTTLSSTQQTAGDTNNNGSLNSFDAALIAQYSVSISNPLSIAGTWKFNPTSRNYASVVTDTPNQNYGAILVGEVSGNWTPPPPFAGFITESPVMSSNPPIAVNFPNAYGSNGSVVTVPINIGKDLVSSGVLSYQIDFNYDAAIVEPDTTYTSVSGTISDGKVVTVNNSTAGRSRIAVFGTTAMNGQGTLINLRFRVIGTPNQVSPLTWTTFFFNEGNPSSNSGNGTITVLAPTSANASVSGRVQTANGNGIRNAVITLTDSGGTTHTTRTSAFGYYRFDEIPIGATIISVASKRFTFANPTQIINVSENLSDVDWTAIE